MSAAGPILLCFDGSPGARRAVVAAGGLMRPRRAVVLSVWEPARDLVPLDPVGDVVGRVSGLYAELDEVTSQATATLAEEGVALAARAGLEASSRVECGAPAHTIVAVADAVDAALVVVGANGGSTVGAMLGSVSAWVSRHAGRPVLVVH